MSLCLAANWIPFPFRFHSSPREWLYVMLERLKGASTDRNSTKAKIVSTGKKMELHFLHSNSSTEASIPLNWAKQDVVAILRFRIHLALRRMQPRMRIQYGGILTMHLPSEVEKCLITSGICITGGNFQEWNDRLVICKCPHHWGIHFSTCSHEDSTRMNDSNLQKVIIITRGSAFQIVNLV